MKKSLQDGIVNLFLNYYKEESTSNAGFPTKMLILLMFTLLIFKDAASLK